MYDWYNSIKEKEYVLDRNFFDCHSSSLMRICIRMGFLLWRPLWMTITVWLSRCQLMSFHFCFIYHLNKHNLHAKIKNLMETLPPFSKPAIRPVLFRAQYHGLHKLLMGDIQKGIPNSSKQFVAIITCHPNAYFAMYHLTQNVYLPLIHTGAHSQTSLEGPIPCRIQFRA